MKYKKILKIKYLFLKYYSNNIILTIFKFIIEILVLNC